MTANPLILLGGTFDPPHLGHLILAEYAREQFGGRVLFLTAGHPWRKAGRAVTAPEHRVAMTSLAVAGNDRFSMDDREVRRPGPTYTVDTLEELHREGEVALILILGADALADLANWKDPDRIRELCTLAVAAREDLPAPEIPGVVPVPMPGIDISSSLVRERVSAGHSIRYLVPDAVREYIAGHGLYRSPVAGRVESAGGTADAGGTARGTAP